MALDPLYAGRGLGREFLGGLLEVTEEIGSVFDVRTAIGGCESIGLVASSVNAEIGEG